MVWTITLKKEYSHPFARLAFPSGSVRHVSPVLKKNISYNGRIHLSEEIFDRLLVRLRS